jgi:hypothetical protein
VLELLLQSNQPRSENALLQVETHARQPLRALELENGKPVIREAHLRVPDRQGQLEVYAVEPVVGNDHQLKPIYNDAMITAKTPHRIQSPVKRPVLKIGTLGRPFGFVDEDLALNIVAAAKKHEYSVREFVQALVQSKAFRTK